MQKLFLSFFYVGFIPWAPGTFGSIAGAVVGYLMLLYLPISTLFFSTLLISIIAIKSIDRYERKTGTHDDKNIVIDEVVGLWVSFLLSSSTVIQMILSLVYFRIFDIWKPSIIGRIDKRVKGGLGVVGDDLLAGLFAGICSAGSWQIISNFLS